VSNQTLIIGRVVDATQYEPFNGAIDELRIWSTQQSQSQINSYKGVTLAGTEPGLLALFSFDQGVPAGNNSYLTTAIDKTTNNNHGTLLNFSLTGTASNYIANVLAPLPVVFGDFRAARQNGQAILQWKTEQETNNAAYVIERSANGKDYEPIGEVKGAGTTTLRNSYTYTDRNPLTGKNYYRLKQVDFNGSFMYSNVLLLDFDGLRKLLWYRTGGNGITVRLDNGNSEHYTLFDVKGSILQSGYLKNGRVQFNNLSSGTYVVRVQSSEWMTLKFVAQ
jgi:hypothetical protein